MQLFDAQTELDDLAANQERFRRECSSLRPEVETRHPQPIREPGAIVTPVSGVFAYSLE
jgi:hypothetical protein